MYDLPILKIEHDYNPSNNIKTIIYNNIIFLCIRDSVYKLKKKIVWNRFKAILVFYNITFS
uniref:Uncharacterized protein n=1 Tax=viral metagenome TaxID=1070528 RepID=A0A6C0ADD8_9ZZZZ